MDPMDGQDVLTISFTREYRETENAILIAARQYVAALDDHLPEEGTAALDDLVAAVKRLPEYVQ